MTVAERLFDPANAFTHPATVGISAAVIVVLALAVTLVHLLNRLGRLSSEQHDELRKRCNTWIIIVFALLIPILIGKGTTVLLGLVLSLLCYTEFARATGLFREYRLNAVVIIGICTVHFAALDNYYRLFVAAWPVTTTLIVATALLPDRPKGYIQRVALAILGFMMFGTWFGHFAYFANSPDYRPILLWLLVGVELNDVFAFLSGRLNRHRTGRVKLCPNTSPNKTVAGAVGAMIITTPLVAAAGHVVFRSQPIDTGISLCVLGLIVSIAGQFGDLVVSAIKRDLGIKDMAGTLPGHGGLLDRFDSLMLVVPVVFHFVNYIQGVAPGMPTNIITGAMGNP